MAQARKNAAVDLSSLPQVVREQLLLCTPQQQRFVIAYCSKAANNGQLAMKMAGSTGDYGTRCALASDTLREPPVRAAIEAWMATYAMGAAEVTAVLADMARCSLEPFIETQPGKTRKVGRGKKAKTVTEPGGMTLRALDEDTWARHAHWVKKVDVDPKSGRITRIEVHDRTKAADLMAKILKLYTDAPQVNLFLYLQNLSDEDLLKEYERTSQANLKMVS